MPAWPMPQRGVYVYSIMPSIYRDPERLCLSLFCAAHIANPHPQSPPPPPMFVLSVGGERRLNRALISCALVTRRKTREKRDQGERLEGDGETETQKRKTAREQERSLITCCLRERKRERKFDERITCLSLFLVFSLALSLSQSLVLFSVGCARKPPPSPMQFSTRGRRRTP